MNLPPLNSTVRVTMGDRVVVGKVVDFQVHATTDEDCGIFVEDADGQEHWFDRTWPAPWRWEYVR